MLYSLRAQTLLGEVVKPCNQHHHSKVPQLLATKSEPLQDITVFKVVTITTHLPCSGITPSKHQISPTIHF